jgi:hypothetical protein
MRLSKVPLVIVGEHVINLNLLANAHVDGGGPYGKYGIRYFMDLANTQEDDDGNQGCFIPFSSKKAAVAALVALSTASDTLIMEEEP